MKNERLTIKEANYLNWLIYIKDIALGYDGYKSVEDLKDLIDELRDFAIRAIKEESCPLNQYKGDIELEKKIKFLRMLNLEGIEQSP